MSAKHDPLFGMPMPEESFIEKAKRMARREREGSAMFGPVQFGANAPAMTIEAMNAARAAVGLAPIPDPPAPSSPPVYAVGGAGGGGGAGDSGQRVTFSKLDVAYKLLEPLMDGYFAIQLTTYPPPRMTGTDDVPGPAAVIDFAEECWCADMVRLLRDITVPLAGRFMDEPAVLASYHLTPNKAAAVLGFTLHKGEELSAALEGGWRAGGKDFIAKALRDLIGAHAAHCTPGRFQFGTMR